MIIVFQVDGVCINADNGYASDCNRVLVIPFSKGVIVNIITKPLNPKKSYTLIETESERVILDQDGKEIDLAKLPPFTGALS